MIYLKKVLWNISMGIRFSFTRMWKDNKLFYFYSIFVMVLETMNSFVMILFPKFLIDGLSDKRGNFILISVVIFVLWQYLYSVLSSWFNKKKEMCSEEYKFTLKTMLMDKLTTLRYEQMEDSERLKQYDYAKKCIDKGNIESYIQSVLSILSSVIVIGGVFFVLRGLPFWVWLIIIFVIITNIIVHIIGAKYDYSEMQEETATERRLYYFRGWLMRKEYGKEIRSYQLSDFIIGRTIQIIEDFFNLCRHYNRKHNRIFWYADFAEGIQTFVLYFYNVRLLFYNMITVGNFMMNVSALFQFSNALNTISTQVIKMAEESIYLQDYIDFLMIPSGYKGQCSVDIKDNYTIEFRNVSFRYSGQAKNIMENMNVTIHSGEKIAIVGANGAGKSTFIKLLLGLYKPTEGKILLNGEDIENLNSKEYIRLFSSVMQDYQLYPFKIIDNILFKEDTTTEEKERVMEIFDMIGLRNTFDKLSNGINSYLTQCYSDTGIELSGGESQKLVIARAMYKNAPIMILDEPTSALSPQSEYDIYCKFNQIAGNKTTICISHRLSSCVLCDRILVFDNGKIVEDGSHIQLMKKKGIYEQMFQSQASLYGV